VKESTQTEGGSRAAERKIFFAAAALSAILFLLYWNSLDGAWQFDDITNIVNNRGLHLKTLSPEGIKKAFFSDPARPGALYRPVSCVTFALNHYVDGLDAFGYHLVNVLTHIVSSFFLFLFLSHILLLPSQEGKSGPEAYSLALLATFFWAIHPIQTQAVTYIVQRMTSLGGMFTIMSMFFYVKARTAEQGKKQFLLLSLCIISFFFAFGCKENAIMLPVSLMLCEGLVLGGAWSRRKRNLVGLVLGVTVLLGILYLHWRHGGLQSLLQGYEGRPFTLGQRLLTEPRIILFYVSQLLYPLPDRFSVAHSIEISSSFFTPPSTGISIIVIACAIVLLIFTAKRHPLISFSFLFFLLNHAVESTVLPLELIFEHRNYVPSMMFFLPFAMGICKLLDRYKSKRVMQSIMAGFVIFVLICFGHSTYLRNMDWKNPKTLWTAALLKAPDQLRVHHNLGLYYQDQGLTERALEEYKKALESPVIHRKNESFMTHYQMGNLCSELGDHQRAIRHYLEAIRLDPNLYLAMVKLAALYDEDNNRALADYYLKEAFKRNHGHPVINLNMAILCLREARPGEAIQHLMVAREDESLEVRARLYLAIAYKQKGWIGRAVVTLRKVRSAAPKDITPYLHLIEVFSRKGDQAKAQEAAEQVAGLMAQNEGLAKDIIDLMASKEKAAETFLSPEYVLPAMISALRRRYDVGGMERCY
jgi:tetratricopeptide (TPR) repeat protein